MIYFIIVLLHCSSAVVSKELLVTGKNKTSYNILGYSSYKSYASVAERLLSKKITDTYNFALKFNKTSPTVILSRVTPEKLIFLQLLHSFDSKSSSFIDFLVYVSNLWSFHPPEPFKFVSDNFKFSPDRVFEITKFVANENPTLPNAISEQLFLLSTEYKVFEHAVKTGDSEVARWLLVHGTWTDRNIDPIIIEEAWQSGYLNIIQLLMENDKITKWQSLPQKIINQSFKNNETLLHVASRNGYADVLTVLASKVTNINIKDSGGKSCVYRATENNKHTVLKTLIARGADIVSEPLLVLAVQRGHIETVSTLINLGTPLDKKDENGITPLFAAVGINNVQILETLAKGLNPALLNSTNDFGDSLLHVAASEGFLDSVKSLVKLRVDVNNRNNHGETPLYKAVNAENLDVIDFLYKSGADVWARTDLGDTIMHLSATLGNQEIVEFLLSEKIRFNINVENILSETPVYKAAVSGKCDMIKFLTDNGGEINRRNEGFTMLHVAAAEGNEKAVTCLLKNGMNVDVTGLWGITPLNLAVTQGHDRIVEKLLQSNANPNAKTKNLWTPLHRAVLNKQFNIIKILQKYNADINAQNDKHLTPLLLAVEKQLPDIGDLLKEIFKID